MLDLCLVLHAEHGGGNNSAFTCRVLSSSGTDTYSAIAAAVGISEGPQARRRQQAGIRRCLRRSRRTVHDWNDDEEITAYLEQICCGKRRGMAAA